MNERPAVEIPARFETKTGTEARKMVRSGRWTTPQQTAQSLAADVEMLLPFRDELLRIAADLGDPDDPFAAWEHIARLRGGLTL